MSAVGLVASGVIETPSAVSQRSAAPDPSLLTATVRRQVLQNTVTFSGRITAGHAIHVFASAPFPVIVITRLPVRAGQRIRPGQLLAEVDGRPVFVLRGTLPAYRDLHEGDIGPDVAQLQRALERIGYADFDAAGYFGESTELALALFYRDRGYSAPADRHEPASPARSRAAASPSASGQVPDASASQPPSQPGRTGQASRHPELATVPPGTAAGHSGLIAGPLMPEAYLPMGEVTYIPAPSALVVSVDARAGAPAPAGPFIRLATGVPVVTGQLGQYQARLVRVGMSASIVPVSPGPTAPGVVTFAGEFPVRNGNVGQPGSHPVVVTGIRPLPQRRIGAQVRLVLLIAATSAPVLAVPLAAITAAGGAVHVIRLAGHGQRVLVTVATGISAGGLVAVRPTEPGALVPGDRVVIGPAG
jgi:peptidoglycan hydrolase-like protein with peptidoglycan-binding domain